MHDDSPRPAHPDAALVADFTHADPRRLDRAMRALLPRVVATARAILFYEDPSVVDDVVQTASLKIVAARDRFDPARGRLLPWVTQVTRFTAIDALRAASAYDEDHRDVDDLDALAHRGGRVGVDGVAVVEAMLDALPSELRDALRARVDGETWHDAAARLGCTVDVLRGRVTRGRRAVAAMMERVAMDEITVANPKA
ncbi:MAG: RNA polymerase sigma factor [Polyangiales bacterium]